MTRSITYHLPRAVTLLCVMVLTSAAAAQDAVWQLLDGFDKAPSAATANAFFRQLQEEEFLDETVIFDASAPMDSIRQQVWYWSAEYLYAHQHYQDGLSNALRALPLMHIATERADCMSLISLHYMRLGNYQQAAAYAKQCYETDLNEGDADRISSSLNTLSTIYLHANQPAEAERYVLKGLEVAYTTGNTARQAVLEANACDVYRAQTEYDKALQHIERAYRLDSIHGRHDRMYVRLSQRAAVLTAQRRYDEAEQLLRPAIVTFRADGNMQSLGIALNGLGAALLGQGRAPEAVECYREAATLFAEMGNLPNEIQAHHGLYEALWDSDPVGAKRELQLFNQLRDSLYTTATAESLARYSAEFGNDWLRLENHAERRAKTVAFIIICVLLILSVAIWWLMRCRHRRANERLVRDIAELKAKYQQLNDLYDSALHASDGAPYAVAGAAAAMSEADRDLMDRATAVTRQMLSEGLADAATLAARLGMSPFQLRKRLRQLVDETPQAFIQDIRMRQARQLLDTHPELTIAEVGELCAYADTSNFTRAFKHAFGITPTQHQQTAR